jgi:hypothetical protein
MTTLEITPQSIAASYGLEAFYRAIVETFPCLEKAMGRVLDAVSPATESEGAFLLIELLSSVTDPSTSDDSLLGSIRSMVQRVVVASPSDIPLAQQWREVRRTLISDAEAHAAGLKLSLLDALP